MNTENILAVADAIENNTIDHLDFNMRYITAPAKSGCGSVACIAGYTLAVKNGVFQAVAEDDHAAYGKIAAEARAWLGLSDWTAEELFFPDSWKFNWGFIDKYDLEKIPKDQAVRTLRHLAASGGVNWEV